MSDWEGSQWSAPTRRSLKGSEYETDQEWQLRNMRYGDDWACDSTQSHCKRAKPTHTDPEDDRWDQRQRRMTQRKMATSGNEVTEAKIGRIHLLRRDHGGQG